MGISPVVASLGFGVSRLITRTGATRLPGQGPCAGKSHKRRPGRSWTMGKTALPPRTTTRTRAPTRTQRPRALAKVETSSRRTYSAPQNEEAVAMTKFKSVLKRVWSWWFLWAVASATVATVADACTPNRPPV